MSKLCCSGAFKVHKSSLTIVLISIGVILLAAIFLLIFFSDRAVKSSDEKPSAFNKYFSSNGLISDFDVSSNVELCSYKGINVKYNDIVNDALIEQKLDEIVKKYSQHSTSPTETANDGDTVNIDYTGYIDNKPVENCSTNGNGYMVTLGSGMLNDDFEEQLLLRHPGEEFTATVRFPDDARSELRGQTVEFTVKLNSILVTPELTDEFVEKYFSDTSKSAEQFMNNIKKELWEDNLRQYLADYIVKNSTVKSYPSDFLQMLIELNHTTYESQYNYYNEQAHEKTGMYLWNNVYDFFEISKEAYEKRVISEAYGTLSYYLVLQAIYQQENLHIKNDTAQEYLTANGYSKEDSEKVLREYGDGFAAQLAIEAVVLDYLVDNSTVVGK